MPALNPFLRALFSSSALSVGLSSENYVLLVPTTDSLLNATDRDSGKRYAEVCEDEDFLGSHILRIEKGQVPKESNVRDSRGKAKTYSTVNNRTVVIKDQLAYTNKGFKSVTNAQLLSDQLYQSPAADSQIWLVVYISKPLVGSYETVTLPLPVLAPPLPQESPSSSKADQFVQPKKKDIQTFSDLLNNFPMIARQMQPGLERVFNEFGKELGKPLPPPPSRSPTLESLDGATQVSDAPDSSSVKSSGSAAANGMVRLPFNSAVYFEDEEDLMRKALETAVTAAIDLFQGVDKQQLSHLGATTDLTGPAVERLIERYVAESVHDQLLFPRLCAFHRPADHDLDRRIRQMDCLDVSQVGIALEDSKHAKRELLGRIDRGVSCFRKIGVAGSPQQMLDVLLETQKVVSEPQGMSNEEKRAAAVTINADILVSLLLIVVIQSGVRHLQARLSYMQRFIFIDDVESGEIGYALSTLEAVLAYLATDAGGLRKASKQNRSLWDAVKSGNVQEIKNIFEGATTAAVTDEPEEMQVDVSRPRPTLSRTSTRSNLSVEFLPNNDETESPEEGNNLSHVFPFQKSSLKRPRSAFLPLEAPFSDQKQKKRVKMATRSMSISSSMSFLSRTATLESTLSGIDGDTSLASLARTQDSTGNSVLMMAVEAQKPNSLSYLLTLDEHYPPDIVLEDMTLEGTTLLSAAIQLSNTEIADIILEYVARLPDISAFKQYLAKQDLRGRSCAHYLFNTPTLIRRLGQLLPWKLKDKIGHTPLFAICRSYDHTNYAEMVSEALTAAKQAQGDGKALNLQDHTDNKGNTLLHILNEPMIVHKLLHHGDVDPNAMNDKKFTPLMLASKYGRVDIVRIFFGDPRVDLYLREARGLTAVELAKDDEVRNRIDDLTLFSDSTAQVPDKTGRITSIVRSFFVEDGTTRYIIKSGAPHLEVSSNTYTITTSRRSRVDFSNLIKWLRADHPASYMPDLHPDTFRSPFQIHSKPSRALLHYSQIQLDRFLKVLLTHPTFSTHEVLWEFFLVPDMQPSQIESRSDLKRTLLNERIAEDYEALTSNSDLQAIDSVIHHSHGLIRKFNYQTTLIVRYGNLYHQRAADLNESLLLASNVLRTLGPPSTTLPQTHIDALSKFVSLTHTETPSSPLVTYLHAQTSLLTTVLGISQALSRPSDLASQIRTASSSMKRLQNDLTNGNITRRNPFNTMFNWEERVKRDTESANRKINNYSEEIERKGKELRYTQEVVLGELAGWTSWREEWNKREIRRFVASSVIREKERLKCMTRVLKNLRQGPATRGEANWEGQDKL